MGVWIDDKGSMKRTMCEKVIKAKRLSNWVSYLVCGRRRKMEIGRIIWKRSVVSMLMFVLAAVSWGKGENEELDVVQRG